MPKLLGFTQSAFDPASRFRFKQYIPYLRDAGWDVIHRPNRPDRQWQSPCKPRLIRGIHYRMGRILMKWNRLSDIKDTGRYDVVFVNRDLAGGGIFFEKRLWRKNRRIVFDYDDAIYLSWNEPAVRWMCSHAAWITTGNEYLAEYARKYNNNVTVIPTVVDMVQYKKKSGPQQDIGRPVRVGWMGSGQSVNATLYPFIRMLARIQKRTGYEFIIISKPKPAPPAPLPWTYWEWSDSNESELAAGLDIGIMPLNDDEFQRGKCGAKLLQYMAAGIPVIASPVGVNREIVRHGITGFLASSEAEWYNALSTLIQDHDLRRRMGSEGRLHCEKNYSLQRWFPELLNIFEKVSRS